MTAQGLLVVDKPEGPTSHSVVAQVRRARGTRKVGHAGTLDPLATGVLVIGIGAATRLLGHLSGQDKEYLATIALGVATDSDDAQGTIISAVGARLEAADIEAAMVPWRGTVRQRPSAVSAVHIDGQRAHARVRAGEEVEMPEREVTVSDFALLDVRHGDIGAVPVTFADVRVTCSTGTYVRALARDVGAALGVGGHVVALRRTRSGSFALADACAVEDVADARLISAGEAARRSLPWAEIADDLVRSVVHGVRIDWPEGAPTQGQVALLHDGDLLALAECRGGKAAYSAVFAPPD
jgi:tRNA pseudouridine55 synthase